MTKEQLSVQSNKLAEDLHGRLLELGLIGDQFSEEFNRNTYANLIQALDTGATLRVRTSGGKPTSVETFTP